MNRDAQRRRDATIVRLNEAGWSLRRIGRHPGVRLSQEGVRRILRRLDDPGPDGWELDPLLLWRDARAGNPRAMELWRLYTARVAEMAVRWAAERHGKPIADLNLVVQQALELEAQDLVVVEMYQELEAAGR